MAEKKLKILEINKFYYLKGGSERYFFSVAKLLAERGHQIIPFAMADQQNQKSEYEKYFSRSVKLNKFSFVNMIKIFYNFDAVRRLKRLIAVAKPDIAHLHNISYQLTPAIINILKKNNIPVVQTLHDYHLICPNYLLFNKGKTCYRCRQGRYYHCFLNRCVKDSYAKSALATLEAYFNNKKYRQIDMFIAPGRFMKNICVDFGIAKEKISVINNFINIKDFRNYAASPTDDYLLYFGRLAPEKGVDNLILAMAATKTDLQCKIVGNGPEKENWQRLIKKHSLQNRVKIINAQYGADLEKLIARARAIVLPSVWPENMPYVMLESLAYGKVVIAAKSGGMTEFIIDKKSGFLYSPHNIAELTHIIEGLPNYDLALIGENARKAAKKADADIHYQKLYDLFTKVLQQNK